MLLPLHQISLTLPCPQALPTGVALPGVLMSLEFDVFSCGLVVSVFSGVGIPVLSVVPVFPLVFFCLLSSYFVVSILFLRMGLLLRKWFASVVTFRAQCVWHIIRSTVLVYGCGAYSYLCLGFCFVDCDWELEC